jgi:hypothetical protein
VLVISGPERTADVSASWILHPAWIDVYIHILYACKRVRRLLQDPFFYWVMLFPLSRAPSSLVVVSHLRRLMTRPSRSHWDIILRQLQTGWHEKRNIAPTSTSSLAPAGRRPPYALAAPSNHPSPTDVPMSLSLNQLGTGATNQWTWIRKVEKHKKIRP